MGVFLTTPLAFAVILALLVLADLLLKRRDTAEEDKRALEPYACGQRDVNHFVAPKYYRTFAFAFFFTVMHVLVLVVATAPRDAAALPIAYVASAVLAVAMLFRRQEEEEA